MRIPAFQGLLIPFLLTMVVSGGITGCATNPVSGTPDVVFMTEATEISIGSRNDAEVRNKYGVYDNPELQAYVQRVGQKLAAQSHRPGLTYHFTVLDTPEVNAFALPGGYIYITRGILAYLNSEAELSTVLGHEIGHVTARHAVRQYTAASATGFVGALVGVATGIPVTQDLFNVLGNAMLSGYGRDHELESDRLGAEYLARAGYDPQAMIKVIGVLKNQEEFEKKRAAAENRPLRIYHGVFASHPSADTRLQEVVAEANKFKTSTTINIAREDYLKQIDKIQFGDIKQIDIVCSDNHCYHKDIDVALSFPEGWQLNINYNLIEATSPDFQAILRVDIEDLVKEMQPDVFLKIRMGVSSLEQGRPIQGMGFPSYSGIAPSSPSFGSRRTRVSVVYYNDKRFLFSGVTNTPESFAAFDARFMATAHSLRPLNAQEEHLTEKATQGLHVRIARTLANDTFANFAKKSPIKDDSESVLRLINDKFPDGEPQAGELIKIIE
ncbi:MAG: M48 family metalloprotease [Sulfuricaulis sp.]|uniref:M48 family metalloprotease n=1 Tax=Sulfuricaulis sp. TaxID=2003553 RepID=UPI003C4B320B